jgi:hypothetical protein
MQLLQCPITLNKSPKKIVKKKKCGSFNTNYIIFKIVESFGSFFFQINKFLEEILNQVRNILFVERKNSKLIKLFNKHVSKLPRYY